MKTIGMIGGMSWESSAEYYRIINSEIKARLGGSHSAKCLMYSFDFHEIEQMQSAGQWDKLTDAMVREAMNLKRAGAAFIIICTNTMHLMAPDIEEKTGLRVLHIADVTGQEIKKRSMSKVALLGTRFTMEGTFYKDVLREKHGIDVIIPSDEDRQVVHDVIYNELVVGVIRDESRKKYIDIIDKMAVAGAQGVVLGCTEIPLLIKQANTSLPVFDTTEIHAKAAAAFSLADA